MKKNEIMNFVDFKVHNVREISEDEFGFDVELIFFDGSSTFQKKCGFSSADEAQAERDKTVGQLYSGQYVAYEDITVEAFMTHWLEEVKRKNLTADSYDAYSNIIYNHIVPFFKDEHVSNIKMTHVQQLYNVKTEFSHSIARLVKTVMNTAMKYAKDNNFISYNPTVGVSLPKNIEKKGYRTRKIDVAKTLTLEQIQLLIEKSKETPIHMQILFAVLMGLRRGEINGLKYSDVDYINRTLTVKRQLGVLPNSDKNDFQAKTYTKQEIRLKTDSSYRTLPIPDYVFEAILQERKKYEKNRNRRKRQFNDLDYICCSSYGRPRSKSYHHKHYKKLLQENGLPDIRWHDLRSTFCTLLIKNNYSPKAVSKLMGHAKEIITLDIYGDNAQLIADGVEELQPFIDEVIPEQEERYKELTDIEINMTFLEEDITEEAG